MGHALGNNYGNQYSFLSKPVWVDCNFVVDATNGNGLGIRSLKGQGVRNVFMHTSATPGKGQGGYLNPNPASGYALVQLQYNYNRYCGGFYGFASPTTGSTVAISGSGLTIGNPYIVASPGHAAAGQVTIAPVADVSGSLASTWFSLYDAYGNTFIIWFSVAGVGARPNLGPDSPAGTVGFHYVQQSIASGATAAQIGTALATTIAALPSGIAGVFSFTASGTTTVTAVNTNTAMYVLPGGPSDGVIPTGFTFAWSVNDSNRTDWMTVGLPAGVVPAAGASFIAKATGVSGASTGTVIAPGVSGITSMEVIGDPNQSLGPVPFRGSPNVGGYILVQLLGATNSSTTTLVPTAPAAGTTIGMGFYVEFGSIIIAGE